MGEEWSSIGECIDTPHVIGKQCPGPNSGDSGCILVSRSRLHEETTPVVDSAAHDLAHAGLQTSTRAETRRRRPTEPKANTASSCSHQAKCLTLSTE